MDKILLSEIDSTNSYAKMNMEILHDRTVIQAEVQTAGRGRLNRVWVNLGKGNLFLSFLLKPPVAVREHYTNLTQYLSVVLTDVLADYGIEAKIKWPNDVLVKDGKIAGILSESVFKGTKFKGLVLGVGVNLNASKNMLSLVTDKKITSLNLETGNKIDCNHFADKLVERFFRSYDNFLNSGFSFIKSAYCSRLSNLGCEIEINVNGQNMKGIFKSVTDKGELELLHYGQICILRIGDIL